MKAWAACNSLDWVTCYPLHFTLAYIVYQESRTGQVVYIHVHYGVHSEMYIGIDSRLIVTLLHYLFSNKKRLGFWLPNQNYWYLVTRTSGSPSCFPPTDRRDSTRGLRIAQMSGQFSSKLVASHFHLSINQVSFQSLVLSKIWPGQASIMKNG